MRTAPSLLVTLAVVVAPLGCGGRGGAPEADAGVVDVDAVVDERCRLSRRHGEPALEAEEILECATCFDAHALPADPLRPAGSIAVSAEAVPGGLVVVNYDYGPVVTFVTTEGERVVLDEMPYGDAPFEDLLEDHPLKELRQELHDAAGVEWSPGLYGWNFGAVWAQPVPESNRVWIGTRFDAVTDLFFNREDMVLYEYGIDGWRRIASDHVLGRASLKRTALDGGELVAEMLDRERLLRIRATDDGTTDAIELLLEQDTALPTDSRRRWANVMDLWGLPNGDLLIMVREVLSLVDAPSSQRTWLGVLDSDLVAILPWIVFGADVEDSTYVSGEAPFAHGGWRRHVNAERRGFVLAFGTVEGTGAAAWQHRWGMWVDEVGELEQEPPGIFLNPDHFLLDDEVARHDRSGAVHGLPGGRVAVVWDDRWSSGVAGSTWGQVVEPDGGTLFEEPQVLGPSINERSMWPWWAQDGAGHAYLAGPEFDGVEMPYLRTGIQRVGIDLQYEWDEPTMVQTCPELVPRDAAGPFIIEGAYEEGVWVIWSDVVPTVRDTSIQVLKVTLIRPDGTFAWD
jgi:hypothetical protein